MADLIEYAQMAQRVYAASDINNVRVPQGWNLINWQPDRISGFSAGAFQKGDEIVISYTGTNEVADMANWTIGLGVPEPQIFEAVAYYLNIKAAHPEATKFSFTGHSLGGGLASLMAVFFDKPATTFDEAPFQLAAVNPTVIAGVMVLPDWHGAVDPAFATYALSMGALVLSREYSITHYAIQGEALGYPRFSFDTLIGADHTLPKGECSASPVNLHSMSLMMAMLVSPNFGDVMQKLPTLVGQMMDENLFAADARDNRKNDLFRHLLRHQFGTASISPDAMLDRLGADFANLTYDVGDLKSSYIVQSIITLGLEHYYRQSTTRDPFFQRLPGGIRFDLTKPLGDDGNPLSAKGYADLVAATARRIDDGRALSEFERFTANRVRWNVALGGGLNGSAVTDSTADLVLGGDNGDRFDAGDGNDLLIGNGGADVLTGGTGDDTLSGGERNDVLDGGDDSDVLLGGDGNDKLIGDKGTDQLNGGDGNDTLDADDGAGGDRLMGDAGFDTYAVNDGDVIVDSDGKGCVDLNKMRLGTAEREQGETAYHDALGNTYLLNGTTLTVNGLTILNYTNGDLSINLVEKPGKGGSGNPAEDPLKAGFEQAEITRSPIVLDLDGNGIATRDLVDGAWFDYDGNGFAQRTGWVNPNDGIVVRDLDGNGRIDNGSELFGSDTRLKNGQLAADGYAALADVDDNADGQIDAKDAVWSELQIWQDANGDGISQDDEFTTLEDLGITAIGTACTTQEVTDANGNRHAEQGSFIREDGTTGTSEDLWFVTNPTNTRQENPLDVPEDVRAMPQIYGMGNVANLWQVMAQQEAAGSSICRRPIACETRWGTAL